MNPHSITDSLRDAVAELSFGPPVAAVYNPLLYARNAHDAYLSRFGQGQREILLVGMNPGPWGMAQTGVPFGAVPAVRDWMGISAPVRKPEVEHPKKPVSGFDCARVEISGKRLWSWAEERYQTPEAFFSRFFVINYCPLLFLADSGKNLTPDKLSASERNSVTRPCDAALLAFVRYFKPTWVIGIGAFAEKRAQHVLAGEGPPVGRILHPSPASPAANRGWAAQAEKQLEALGITL